VSTTIYYTIVVQFEIIWTYQKVIGDGYKPGPVKLPAEVAITALSCNLEIIQLVGYIHILSSLLLTGSACVGIGSSISLVGCMWFYSTASPYPRKTSGSRMGSKLKKFSGRITEMAKLFSFNIY